MEGVGSNAASAVAPLAKWRHDFARTFQYNLDRSTPHMVHRWLGTLVIALIYILRVYYVQGFYIVSYGLGIYILNLLIGFLSPKVDPELEALDGISLPMKETDEFRPFIRRLPEFKFCIGTMGRFLFGAALGIFVVANFKGIFYIEIFMSCSNRCLFFEWYAITKAFVVAFSLTFFSVFDVPVFWPILVCYWVVLFVLTMKRQIMHMIKYKYIPFSIGKKKYGAQKSSARSNGVSKD